MEGWCSTRSKCNKSYWLAMMMMIHTTAAILFVIVQPVYIVQGACIEEERKALLEIKASLVEELEGEYDVQVLPTWVDHGSHSGGDECCDWERVKCNTSTGHVTELSFHNLKGIPESYLYMIDKIWPLNVSLFLHFEELTSLNLSANFLDGRILNTELKSLSSLKKLEILDLGMNPDIDNGIIPSLSALTSLVSLNLQYANLEGYIPINALENLETLDLSVCGLSGFEKLLIMKNLKTLNLEGNYFNGSLVTLLSALPSLETLDLSNNHLSGSFPAQGFEKLPTMKHLKTLNLAWNNFNGSLIASLSGAFPSLETLDLSGSFSAQGFEKLPIMKNLKTLNLEGSKFNGSLVTLLSALPSLETLDLYGNHLSGPFPAQGFEKLPIMKNLKTLNLGGNKFNWSLIASLSSVLPSLETIDLAGNHLSGSFPAQESSNLSQLKVLILRDNEFNGTLPMEALVSFRKLEVLDLSGNNFVGSIPSAIRALSSLKAVSFAQNKLTGSLPDPGLCELKNLHELDLSGNMFHGYLPQCFKNLSSLKLLDISSNQFTRMLLPSLISSLTSLEYIDFSHNKFERTFSFSSFSNNKNLEVVRFIGDDDKFELETEEPIGWIPMFQLKVLVLSKCNMNKAKGSMIPSFLFHQHKLHVLDLSSNSLEGQFPNWLIENNKMLEALILMNNSFSGNICMPMYRNYYTKWLDISGNHMNGTIPGDLQKFLPNMISLNLSSNALSGVIPSSIDILSGLQILDLSDNELSGEVPNVLFTQDLMVLKLSKNRLHGEVLSGNLSFSINALYLDSNYFSGKIGNASEAQLDILDISNNFFTGTIPSWMSNMDSELELAMRNNRFEGRFPCGSASFIFLDISENYFSGSIPSCLNWQNMKHLHLGFNRFTGLIPNSFRNLTVVLTLDIGHNSLSGTIPEFLSELSNLRILLLRNNNFSGPIPKQLCQLVNASFIDLSSNSLSGSVPRCLQNVTGPTDVAFTQTQINVKFVSLDYTYERVFLVKEIDTIKYHEEFEAQDEVQFTTKSLSLPYKGNILNYMSGLDLSCNKLTSEIPKELGLLTQIYTLNLSHNQLTGLIPESLSNLENIESLDLSSNGLTGKVPSELIRLKFLAVFNVSYNNLSGRLPEMKEQFGTFTSASYEGNPLLCGLPLEKKCTSMSRVTEPSSEEEGTEKWYDMDMACFYGSSCSTLVVFMLGFAALLYTNPYWRRRWLDLVEESMYTCYYFLYDSFIWKLYMIFRN